METRKPKIALYAERNFTAKMTDTFDFVFRNRKPLLRYIIYLLLPVSIIQSYCMDRYFSANITLPTALESEDLSSGPYAEWLLSYGLYAVVSLLGGLLLSALVFALLRIYFSREEGLEGLTSGMLTPLIMTNLSRQLGMLFYGLLLMILFCAVAAGLASVTPMLLLPVVLLFIVVLFPMMLWLPAYLLEDNSILDALSKALRLGFATWGGLFGFFFLLSILLNVAQMLIGMPYFITMVAKGVVSQAGEVVSSAATLLNSLHYLFGVVFCFGSYLASAVLSVGLAFHFGHASKKLANNMPEENV